jgi:hypothetical protein
MTQRWGYTRREREGKDNDKKKSHNDERKLYRRNIILFLESFS